MFVKGFYQSTVILRYGFRGQLDFFGQHLDLEIGRFQGDGIFGEWLGVHQALDSFFDGVLVPHFVGMIEFTQGVRLRSLYVL